VDDLREDIEDDESIPPWERPGCFRMDCEPHRGDMLWWLGNISLILGVLALVPCCGWMPGLLGIPLGLCSKYLAKGDLAKIRAGPMDPYGEGLTKSAMNLSSGGLWCSIIGTVVWGGLALFMRWLVVIGIGKENVIGVKRKTPAGVR
jgi:hypothetical protein